MSFEDQLRQQTRQVDYSDIDKLLRKAARESVNVFRKNCVRAAQRGETFLRSNAYFVDAYVSRSIYAVPDACYAMEKAKSQSSSILRDHVYILLSDAERFMGYVREEFQKQDMLNARISCEREFLDTQRIGLFGGRTPVRRYLNRYSFPLSLSW